MTLREIVEQAVLRNASDLFIVAGEAIAMKVYGSFYKMGERLDAEASEYYVNALYESADRDKRELLERGDDDFSFAIGDIGRFRVNAYKQRGSFAAVIRVVKFVLPNPEGLHIPPAIVDLYKQTKGLVLVTGPAASGKSTTLACIIDAINHRRTGHIITLEDPIEFMHRHNESIVSQREIGIDTANYVTGLRAALREAPDVILLGEMRDLETMSIAMTAAETGQLVLSTLHTLGVANTIDRIIDVFPPSQQQQVRVQLAMVLKAVISQQLIPTEKGLIPAFEIMYVNSGMRHMIREGKVHQIEGMLASLGNEGMQTMDSSLLKLFQQGKITKEQAQKYSLTPENMQRKLNMY